MKSGNFVLGWLKAECLRFVFYTAKVRYVSSELDIGAREGGYMKRKQKLDPDVPYGKLVVVKDFLPPPEELVRPDQVARVTIFLKKSSVDFFKHEASKHHTKYQKMIRELLDKYVTSYRRNK